MTIPNLLTLTRIFLTPVLAWFILERWMRAAFCAFFIAGMTDALDGLIARILNQKSRLGSLIDPIADKLLLVTSFLLLWKIGEAPLWLMLIVVGRDVVILGGFFVLSARHVHFEIRPLVSSKLNTLFELGTVFALLGKPILELPGWMYSVLFFLTAFLSMWSGTRYFTTGVSMLKQHPPRNAG